MSMPTPTVPVTTPIRPVTLDPTNMETMKADIGLMIQYAISTGKELPSNLVLDKQLDDETMIANYNNIRKVVAPTTVESIKYINAQMIRSGNSMKWYQVPIFTKCVIIAAIALVSLIGISLSPIVNEVNQAQGLLESSGLILLYNLIFICAASLLGVMFYLLKTLSVKIKNYTLLPVDSVELNAMIIIGVISGFVISELFAYSMKDLGGDYVQIKKMTLALLGGFSSDAIFSILQSVVNKFKGLIGN